MHVCARARAAAVRRGIYKMNQRPRPRYVSRKPNSWRSRCLKLTPFFVIDCGSRSPATPLEKAQIQVVKMPKSLNCVKEVRPIYDSKPRHASTYAMKTPLTAEFQVKGGQSFMTCTPEYVPTHPAARIARPATQRGRDHLPVARECAKRRHTAGDASNIHEEDKCPLAIIILKH